jgi:hypothetical protein
MYPHPTSYILIILTIIYITFKIVITIGHTCHYKKTQYYALYHYSFQHVITNQSHTIQYSIYQSLLAAFSKDSELLITTDPYKILLIHPSGIYCFHTTTPLVKPKTIHTIIINTHTDIYYYIDIIKTKKPRYSPHQRTHFYDAILSNPAIPFV